MVMASPKPCKRCKRPTRNASGYCDAHEPAQRARQRTAARAKVTDTFYGSAVWQKVRKLYRQRQPLCEQCKARGQVRQAALVDHLVPIKHGGEPLSFDNLQSLCTRCHAKKTAEDRRKYGS